MMKVTSGSQLEGRIHACRWRRHGGRDVRHGDHAASAQETERRQEVVSGSQMSGSILSDPFPPAELYLLDVPSSI